MDETEFREKKPSAKTTNTLLLVASEIREKMKFIEHEQNGTFYKRNIHGTKKELWKIKIMIAGKKKTMFRR